MEEEAKIKLRSRQEELTKMISSIEQIIQSEEWLTLKQLHFDGLVERLKRQMLNESLLPTVKTENLYRLQGEISVAKKYADLNEFASTLRKELEGIKKQLR